MFSSLFEKNEFKMLVYNLYCYVYLKILGNTGKGKKKETRKRERTLAFVRLVA